MTLNPTNLPNGTMYVPISGLLDIQDNRLELHPMLSVRDDQRLSLDQRRSLLNPVEFSAVIHRLAKANITMDESKPRTDIIFLERYSSICIKGQDG